MSNPQKETFADYFKEDKEKDVWICQVVVEEGNDEVGDKICGAEFSRATVPSNGSRAFNLRRHMARAHQHELAELEKEKQMKKAKGNFTTSLLEKNINIQFYNTCIPLHPIPYTTLYIVPLIYISLLLHKFNNSLILQS
jgi:hypothetical protein